MAQIKTIIIIFAGSKLVCNFYATTSCKNHLETLSWAHVACPWSCACDLPCPTPLPKLHMRPSQILEEQLWSEGREGWVLLLSLRCVTTAVAVIFSENSFFVRQPIFLQLVLVQSKEAKLTLNEVSYIQCASSTPTPLKKLRVLPSPWPSTYTSFIDNQTGKWCKMLYIFALQYLMEGNYNKVLIIISQLRKLTESLFLHYSRSVALIHLNLVD